MAKNRTKAPAKAAAKSKPVKAKANGAKANGAAKPVALKPSELALVNAEIVALRARIAKLEARRWFFF